GTARSTTTWSCAISCVTEAHLQDGQRLRGDSPPLPGAWKRLCPASSGHVRFRALGQAQTDSSVGPRPDGRETALLVRTGRVRRLRVGAQDPAALGTGPLPARTFGDRSLFPLSVRAGADDADPGRPKAS